MAYSYEDTVGSGASNIVSVPFPYITRAHVHVYVSGVEVPAADLTWLTSSTIQLPLGAASYTGHVLRVQRKTPEAAPLVTFNSGSLDTQALNLAFRQTLYLAQELRDGGLPLAADGSLDAGGKRISSGGDPLYPQDFVTKNWAETSGSSFVALAMQWALQAVAAAEETLNRAGAFIGAYNAAHTYGYLDRTRHLGAEYLSLQAGNTAHTPGSSPLWWEHISGVQHGGQIGYFESAAYTANTTITGAGMVPAGGSTAVPLITDGLEVASAAYACQSVGGKLKLSCGLNLFCGAGSAAYALAAMFRDSVCIGVGLQHLAINGAQFPTLWANLGNPHPGDLSSHTYSVRISVTSPGTPFALNGFPGTPSFAGVSGIKLIGAEMSP